MENEISKEALEHLHNLLATLQQTRDHGVSLKNFEGDLDIATQKVEDSRELEVHPYALNVARFEILPDHDITSEDDVFNRYFHGIKVIEIYSRHKRWMKMK
jgi:hypothetical protein